MSLLLSSIWVQATSTENSPANFEAMAHTYNIALLFTRSKVSYVYIVYYYLLSHVLCSFCQLCLYCVLLFVILSPVFLLNAFCMLYFHYDSLPANIIFVKNQVSK